MARKNGLTRRQAAFVSGYLVTMNAAQAAREAGYSAKTAAQIGERLLRNVDVAKAIELAMSERSLRTEITADRTLRELSYVCFHDIGEVFNEDGTVKPIHMMREDVRRAIASFEVTAIHNEDGNVIGHTTKVKLFNKIEAIEKVMRHLGMFEDRLRVKFDNPLAIMIQQVQGRTFVPVVIQGGKDEIA